MDKKAKKGVIWWLAVIGIIIIVVIVPFLASRPDKPQVYFICQDNGSERFMDFLEMFKSEIKKKVGEDKISISRSYEINIAELKKGIVEIFFSEPSVASITFEVAGATNKERMCFIVSYAVSSVLNQIREFEREGKDDGSLV